LAPGLSVSSVAVLAGPANVPPPQCGNSSMVTR